MCYGDPSATEVPPCCETATKKLTFSTTSVLRLLNMPLSLSRATIFRRQKNPRRVYRPKIAGILFVCNEPEGKYYTVPTWCRPTAIDNERAMKLEDADDGRPPSQRARVHTGREATRRRTTDDSEVNVREPPTMKAPAEVALEASERGVRRKRRRRVCMSKRVFASPYNQYVVVKHKQRKWRRGLRGGKTMTFT